MQIHNMSTNKILSVLAPQKKWELNCVPYRMKHHSKSNIPSTIPIVLVLQIIITCIGSPIPEPLFIANTKAWLTSSKCCSQREQTKKQHLLDLGLSGIQQVSLIWVTSFKNLSNTLYLVIHPKNDTFLLFLRGLVQPKDKPTALLDQPTTQQKGATHLVDLLNLQLFGCHLFAFDAFSLPKAGNTGCFRQEVWGNGIGTLFQWHLYGIAKHTIYCVYINIHI